MTRLLVTLAVAVVAVVTAIVVLPGSADAADLFVAPSGNGTACSASAPCGSLDAAYRAAKPGDVVEVGGGTYPPQVVPSLGRPAPAVEFRSAEGGEVIFTGLDVKADHVVLRGMRSSAHLDVDASAADPVEHVHLIDMHTKVHWLNNARDFTWTRGSIGPSFNDKASMIGGEPASERITYDGVVWHDATRDNQSVHMECLFAASVQGLTIRNSRFTNCAVFDILITRLEGNAQPRDIVLENNVFERSRDVGGGSAFYAFAIHDNVTLNRLVLRNNAWDLGWSGGTVQSGRVVGNVGTSDWAGGCRSGLTYSHNVWTVKKCGPTDKLVPNLASQFVNSATGDWRLKPGAAAINAGDPADYPSLDAFGNVRPFGGAPDAGPHEFGSHPPNGTGENTGYVPTATDAPARGTAKRKRGRVLKVIDGRTLRVRIRGGKVRTVRILGVRMKGASRCGGPSPRSRLRSLAPVGTWVTMQGDPRAARRDRAGRMLVYLRRARRDLGKVLIARGWARAATSVPLKRMPAYQAAQRQANRKGLGLWRCR